MYLEEEAGVGAGTPLERAPRAVWGMLYADDAGVVSRSQERLTRMMTIIVEVFGEFGLIVSEKKTKTLDAGTREAAEERGITATTTGHRSSGAKVRSDRPVPILGRPYQRRWRAHAGDQPPESRAAWACIRRFSRKLFDRPRALWRLKVRLLRAKATEALLYGCMTWAPRRDHYRLRRRKHHRLLLRVIGYRGERGTYRQLSYAQALNKTGCQSVGATIRQRRLLFAGARARQPAGRLPKRLMDGKLVEGEDPGKRRPEQNWLDCLKDDFQAFGATDGSTVDNRLIFGVDRAVWTLAAKMDDGAPWHKGVLHRAEKFMTCWHKEEEETEEEEASRRRATKRDFRDLEPPTLFVGMYREWHGRCKPGGEYTRPSRGTRIKSCDFIVLIGDLRFFLFVLFCLASRVEWERWARSISFARHVACDV